MANPITIRALKTLANQYHRVHRRLYDGFCQRCSIPWPCEYVDAAGEFRRLARILANGDDVDKVNPLIDAAILERMRSINESIHEPEYGQHDCGRIGG